jgi:molybdopterin-guanine dinucleotide biosynthesis protein A
MTRIAVAGVFVGGAATRMGGLPKGLLLAPDGKTVVERTHSMLLAAGVREVVLVGARSDYGHLGVPMLDDHPPRIGPLGGLIALLERARGGYAVAVACDMPFVSTRMFERLLAAPEGSIVAPRCSCRWEPLCSRYDAATVLPFALRRAEGFNHSLQGLLDEVVATELALTAKEAYQLRDWDTPADVSRER